MSEDQSPALDFLKTVLRGQTSDAIEIVETHISVVLIAGARVFKLKRAVRLPYLDFSTPALRLRACQAEVNLNRRAAPDLYVGVRRIFRANGALTFEEGGELVDAVVEMRRFEERSLYDVMVREDRITAQHIETLAETIARFHARAEVVRARPGAQIMTHVLDLGDASFAAAHLFEMRDWKRLSVRFRREAGRLAPLLDARSAAGFVRHCHGDLHLRNICLFEGRPTPFDCIEFDDALATIDLLYDLAFPLMDLWRCGRLDLANLLFNRYADAFEAYAPPAPATMRDGFAALPFFMAVRAAIRAHIAAGRAGEGGPSAPRLVAEAHEYFDLANALLAPRDAALMAVGGFSGSGKSTLAAALAPELGPPPGARTLNSDRIRKAMHRMRPQDQLPPEAYDEKINAAVYLRLLARGGEALAQGRAVILDAVYSKPQERAEVEDLARKAKAPFVGVWLGADPDILRARVRERPKGPSDATPAVLDAQLARGTGEIDWLQVDSGKPDWLARARENLSRGKPPKN